jgi:hypothetical protein
MTDVTSAKLSSREQRRAVSALHNQVNAALIRWRWLEWVGCELFFKAKQLVMTLAHSRQNDSENRTSESHLNVPFYSSICHSLLISRVRARVYL